MRQLREITVIGKYIAILAIMNLLLSGCLKPPTRLQPSGSNSSFELEHSLPFNKYIDHYRKIIEQTRDDLQDWNSQTIISANTPFELVPDEQYFKKDDNGSFPRGIVLIHGLSDSPYHMKYLAEHFRKRGFLT